MIQDWTGNAPKGPPLLLVPPAIELQVLTEGVNFFRGLLDVRLVRGNSRRNNSTPANLQDLVISPEGFEVQISVYNCMESRKLFILSFYMATSVVTTRRPLEDDGDNDDNQQPTPTLGPGEFTARKTSYTVRAPFMAMCFLTILVDEAYVCRNPKNVISKLI